MKQQPRSGKSTPQPPLPLKEAQQKARDPSLFQGIGETIKRREQREQQQKSKAPVVFPPND